MKDHYIGPLPPPTEGQSKITAQYLEQYSAPWPGSRFILRLVQQINGWRNLPHRIEAILARPKPLSSQEIRQSAAASPR